MFTKKVIIHQTKIHSILRGHPWIFSGAIKDKSADIQEGDCVQIMDEKSKILGFGHFQNSNIAVKILGWSPLEYSDEFWLNRIQSAYTLRLQLAYINSSSHSAFRLVHGEGDGLPGLIIDIYGDVAIIQCHSVGMHRNIQLIAQALQSIFKDKIQHIYDKSSETISSLENYPIQNGFLFGGKERVTIIEYEISFEVNWIEGQKTGFFLDQKVNRNLLRSFCKDKSVLNTFSYTGGFSLNALAGGANLVHSVDSSSKAIAQLESNLILNSVLATRHESFCTDAIHYLKTMNKDLYDVIVLDPPAFAKNISKRHNAIQAYKRINLLAFQKIKKSGVLFTFSCSQVVTDDLFYHTIVSAGIESGRNIRLLHRLHQSPDHPVHLFHPEGSYLKGLVLFVE